MKEPIAKAPSGRPSRQPVGLRNRMTVQDQDPNYHYRWVSDSDKTGDRIEQFKAAGYEVVPRGTHKVGNSRVQAASPEGSVETLSVGGGITGVLMRQKKEFYDEDQAAKQERVDATEESLRKPTLDGQYGHVFKK